MDIEEINQIVQDSVTRAIELVQSGMAEDAEKLAKQILVVSPDDKNAIFVLALSLSKLNRHDEAESTILRCLQNNPNDYQAFNNLGIIHGNAKKPLQAINCFKRAISINPNDVTHVVNLGLEYFKINDFDSAEKTFLSIPESPHSWFNYGSCLGQIKSWRKAEKAYLKCIELMPEHQLAKFNLSHVYLHIREWEKGWKLFESRWEQKHLKEIKESFTVPEWDGKECDSLLIYCEQGLGDVIHFSRFFDSIPAKKIYLKSDAADVLGIEKYNNQHVDCCISAMSLPLMLGINNAPLRKINVLTPADSWEKYDQLRVGLCWAGSPLHPHDKTRSMHLNLFSDMMKTQNTKWFTLCPPRGFRLSSDGEILNFEENAFDVNIVDMTKYINNISLLASIIDQMDVVITVDSAVAHLAGTMGKKVWIMIPYNNEWRWGDDDEYVWYESARIFRQKVNGDWRDVLTTIHFELIKLTIACNH